MCNKLGSAAPAIDWLPDDMALSMMKTKSMNKKGATTRRIKVELLFRKATLAARHMIRQHLIS